MTMHARTAHDDARIRARTGLVAGALTGVLAGVHRLAVLIPLLLGAWVLVVLLVGLVSGDLATTIVAVPLVVLVLPALVVSSVTRRGPHPGA